MNQGLDWVEQVGMHGGAGSNLHEVTPAGWRRQQPGARSLSYAAAWLGLMLLACQPAWAQVSVQGELNSSTVARKVYLYGKARHTNTTAIAEIPGGLLQYAYNVPAANIGLNLQHSHLTLKGTNFLTTAVLKSQNYGNFGPVYTGMQTDYYLVRYEGFWDVPTTGAYTFVGSGDDLVRVFLDGDEVYCNVRDSSATQTRTVTAGRHTLMLEFNEWAGGATYSFSGTFLTQGTFTAATLHPFSHYVLEYRKTYTDAAPAANRLRMEVYDNATFAPTLSNGNLSNNKAVTSSFTGSALWTLDSVMRYDLWGRWPIAPIANLLTSDDTFALRFIGQVYLDAAGAHTFQVAASDDIGRVWVDKDNDGIDLTSTSDLVASRGDTVTPNPGSVTVAAAGWYGLVVEFLEKSGSQWCYVLSPTSGRVLGVGRPVRSQGTITGWEPFASGTTAVGTATADGLLGTFDADALGLPNGTYEVRLRVYNLHREEVTDSLTVKVAPAGTALFVR